MAELEFPPALEDEEVRLRALAERDASAYAAAFVRAPGLGVALGIEEDPSAEDVLAKLPRIEAARVAGAGSSSRSPRRERTSSSAR